MKYLFTQHTKRCETCNKRRTPDCKVVKITRPGFEPEEQEGVARDITEMVGCASWGGDDKTPDVLSQLEEKIKHTWQTHGGKYRTTFRRDELLGWIAELRGVLK